MCCSTEYFLPLRSPLVSRANRCVAVCVAVCCSVCCSVCGSVCLCGSERPRAPPADSCLYVLLWCLARTASGHCEGLLLQRVLQCVVIVLQLCCGCVAVFCNGLFVCVSREQQADIAKASCCSVCCSCVAVVLRLCCSVLQWLICVCLARTASRHSKGGHVRGRGIDSAAGESLILQCVVIVLQLCCGCVAVCCNGLFVCASREQQADIAKAGMCVVEASIDSAAGEGLMLQGAQLVAALRRSLPASDTNRCLAVCCSVWQYVAVCCSMLQCVAVTSGKRCLVAVCCSVLQCVAVCCRTHMWLPHSCCSVLQHSCCSVL